jgi:hypothetical protein
MNRVPGPDGDANERCCPEHIRNAINTEALSTTTSNACQCRAQA